MRTQGILLVRDAILLLAFLPVGGEHCTQNSSVLRLRLNSTAPDARHGLWRQSCDRLLGSLEALSQNLLDRIQTVREHGDESGADIICSTCVTCLAHLSVLYEAVGRIDPVAEGMFDLCDSALRRLGKLTFDIRFDEYTYLDLLLGVCPFPPCHLMNDSSNRLG